MKSEVNQLSLFGGRASGEPLPCRSYPNRLGNGLSVPRCCNREMIPVWFRSKFKGFVCVTGQPMHWIPTKKLGAMGFFSSPYLRDRSKVAKTLMSVKGVSMKLERRGLLRPADLPSEGADFKVMQFRDSQGEFYKYDLVLQSSDGEKRILGLQGQSFNVDSLIDILGDNTDKWPGQFICLYPSNWKQVDVIRIKRAQEDHKEGRKK